MAKQVVKLSVTKRNSDTVEEDQYFQSKDIHDMTQPVAGGAKFRYTPGYSSTGVDYVVTQDASAVQADINT